MQMFIYIIYDLFKDVNNYVHFRKICRITIEVKGIYKKRYCRVQICITFKITCRCLCHNLIFDERRATVAAQGIM